MTPEEIIERASNLQRCLTQWSGGNAFLEHKDQMNIVLMAELLKAINRVADELTVLNNNTNAIVELMDLGDRK